MNNNWKIFIIKGRYANTEIPLQEDSLFIGREGEKTRWKPEIDLFDQKVTKKHARIFIEQGSWWIEDMGNTGTGSKHGTLVGQKKIVGPEEATKLLPGVPVTMGNTQWVLTPPNTVVRIWNDLLIAFEVEEVLNYAIYQCNIPTISNVRIRNIGALPSPRLRLTASIKKHGEWNKDFEPLLPESEIPPLKIPIDLNYRKLEGLNTRTGARLEIKINGEILFDKKITLLGFYEYCFAPKFRRTLACFVMPAHPVVQNIILDAVHYLKNLADIPSFTHLFRADLPNRFEIALRAIYECLKVQYNILYAFEPAGTTVELQSQMIRPPHRILSGSNSRTGAGTCIDLALLVASCLENIHLQPLIIFVREDNNGQHAFIGCWREITERAKPIWTDYKEFLEADPLVLETTGFTNCGGEKKLAYDKAVEAAKNKFSEERFLFALDIAAARQTVAPLQFPMSPDVITILRDAELLAREEASPKLETRHLLYSFFQNISAHIHDEEYNNIREVLRVADIDVNKVLFNSSAPSSIRKEITDVSPRPTINYRRVLEDARLFSSDSGLEFVEIYHLFYALIYSQSESVDALFTKLGKNQRQVKLIFKGLFDWSKEIIETWYDTSSKD